MPKRARMRLSGQFFTFEICPDKSIAPHNIISEFNSLREFTG
jgi:hypothetical protein